MLPTEEILKLQSNSRHDRRAGFEISHRNYEKKIFIRKIFSLRLIPKFMLAEVFLHTVSRKFAKWQQVLWDMMGLTVKQKRLE